LDQIAAAQFTVDSQIEQSKVAMVLGQLEPHAD
jgi:hypothetical protein